MSFFSFCIVMYLGIDFLITSQLQPYVVEVNAGLPGGAQEYHLTHLVYFGKPSDIFRQIEETSQRVYGKTFKDYLHSLPFIESLKPFKIWIGGKGLQVITEAERLSKIDPGSTPYLLQEYIESKIDGYNFSIRSIAFGGESMCIYSNLSTRSFSNHGTLAFIS